MNKSQKTVFVTGATGLLGSNTVLALLSKQYHVKALARSEEKARKVLRDDSQLQVVVGDLMEPETWLSHLEECDVVIHAAAYFREYFGRGEHDHSLTTLNVDFPVRLIKEGIARGVSRFVMISSTGVISGRSDGLPSSEGDPANVQIPGNGYQESKKMMEVALSTLDLHGAELVIVRPGWMWGPGDYAPTATGQIVLDMLGKKTFQFVGGTPFGIVDARDVAFGLAQIVAMETPKRLYHLAGYNITALEAIQTIAKQIGTVKVQSIPYGAAIFLSGLLEFFTRMTGARNPLPREGIEVISKGVQVSSELAKSQLGVHFRPFTETAKDTVSFVRSNLV